MIILGSTPKEQTLIAHRLPITITINLGLNSNNPQVMSDLEENKKYYVVVKNARCAHS